MKSPIEYAPPWSKYVCIFQGKVDPGVEIVQQEGARGAGRNPVRPQGGRQDTRSG